jgi:mRNA-degrading endonuclease RelE of RelBE toxin-antitoxin system
MTIEEKVVEKLRELPAEKQQKVLEFVASLQANGSKKPLRSLHGLWKDFQIHITDEDIAEARSEMWGKFSRDVS